MASTTVALAYALVDPIHPESEGHTLSSCALIDGGVKYYVPLSATVDPKVVMAASLVLTNRDSAPDITFSNLGLAMKDCISVDLTFDLDLRAWGEISVEDSYTGP